MMRVAAYCRVSTDKEDQVHSLQSQRSYFADYISGQPDWTLVRVYADEAASGTSTRRRTAFNQMIQDARSGQLDLILTKEVSRFARNTVDTLRYTRKLKELGVGVRFLNDNIDTRENDGELRLTLMASIAQEESRKTSERVKWGQQRRMEQGVVFGNDTTYGFFTRQGQLTVKEEEADIVRLIYRKYLFEGKGTHIIARELSESGVATPSGAQAPWSSAMIRRILRNEKYCGDLVQKKTITTDYLTHHRTGNRGQEALVCLRDHHTAIIPRQQWLSVQEELARRRSTGDAPRYSARYWCSGKLLCGLCGSRLVLRKRRRPNGDLYQAWCCHTRLRFGAGCPGDDQTVSGCGLRMLNDKALTACVCFALTQLPLDYDSIVKNLLAEVQHLSCTPASLPASPGLEKMRAALEEKKRRALDAYCNQLISQADLRRLRERYEDALERLSPGQITASPASERPAGALDVSLLSEPLRQACTASEPVFAQVVEAVVLSQDSILIRFYGLSRPLRLWFDTQGRREHYRTEVLRWRTE